MFILLKRIFFFVLKHANLGDFNISYLVEVEKLMAGKARLRIQRKLLIKKLDYFECS